MINSDYPEPYTDDVWSAIELAEELKRTGEFDLFRGQRNTFPIQPSALRPGVNRESVERQLRNFAQWVHSTPDLQSLHGNQHAILAVAQHYGLKTPLLDFSRSPRIAGFFATDGGKKGETGTIICLNRKRFSDSWSDINRKYRESKGMMLAEIINIDVRNLWRLQAQEGEFLRCHVDPSFLEMFSCFLHIHFPQECGIEVLEQARVYPSERSHIEVLLDQYFLIDSYPERTRKLEETFGQSFVISEESMRKEIVAYFKDHEIPEDHESWGTPAAKEWLREPDEKYIDKGLGVTANLICPMVKNRRSFEVLISNQLNQIIKKSKFQTRDCIHWNVIDEKGRTLYVDGDGRLKRRKYKDTLFSVAEMVSSIYAGMRYLPYKRLQIIRTITRYLEMLTFGIYQVIDDAEGIELSGGGVRGRGFGSKRKIREALRDDFFDLICPDRLNSSGEMDFSDALFASSYVRSSYIFDAFLDLFIEDLIPSQAVIAIEGLVIGVNPMRIDVFGES